MEEKRKEVKLSRTDTSAGHSDLAFANDHEPDPVASALDKGRRHLAELQRDDGTWNGRVAASNLATAKVILLHLWLDRKSDEVDSAFETLVADQQADGGYSRAAPQYGSRHSPAESDLDTTVLVHLIRRLAGEPVEDPAIQSSFIALGNLGACEQCDALTRYWLALFGQISWSQCPVVWPQSSGLPAWWPSSFSRSARWNQQLQLPLSLLISTRPRKVVEPGRSATELFSRQTSRMPKISSGLLSTLTGLVRPGRAIRRSTLKKTEQRIVDQVTSNDGLGGSLDATILAIVALVSRGHARTSRAVDHCLHAIDQAWDAPSNRWSESLTTTMDTALATRTLAWDRDDSDSSSRVRNGVEWLLSQEQEIATSESSSTGQGGWCREHSQSTISVPATSAVLLALREQFSERPPSSLVTDDSMVAMIQANSLNAARQEIAILDRVAATSRRARHWVMAMQNRDGGWGHYDLANPATGRIAGFGKLHRDLPVKDTSTVAVTGQVLQSMGAWEMGCGQTHVDRAVSFLREKQNADGSWPAAHDACEFQSTWAAVEGLRSVGIPRRDSTLVKSAEWVQQVEHSDDGWADDPLAAAWAVMCLVATGHRMAEPTLRGIQYLIDSQLPTGDWAISARKTAAPCGLINPYVTTRTNVSSTTYPVMALACYVRQAGGSSS